MSRAAWPGAIIGYTFSSAVTRTSTSTGPGVASTDTAIPLDAPSGPTADNPTAVPDPAASQP